MQTPENSPLIGLFRQAAAVGRGLLIFAALLLLAGCRDDDPRPNISLDAVGSAGLEAFAEASINLLVASGGVGANLPIVEDDFELVTELDLTKMISNSLMTQ